MKPSSDVKVCSNRRMKVTVGTRPKVSCGLGATPTCLKTCYAERLAKFRPAVGRILDENTKLNSMGEDDAYWELFSMLHNESDAARVGQFRLYWAGDWPKQHIVNAWFRVVQDFPDVTFWTYTRQFHLDYTGKPSNLTILASMDDDNREACKVFAKRWGFGIAVMSKEDPGLPRCPHETGDVVDCVSCGHCQAGKDVWFYQR